MVWVVSRFRLKVPPGISSSCISPLTSSGQRSHASWASQPQKSATLSPQPGGKPRKFTRKCGGVGKKNCTTLSAQVRDFSLTDSQHDTFYGEKLLAPRPKPKPDYHPLSAVRDCLFNIFVATLHTGGRSSIRNLRTRLALVRGYTLITVVKLQLHVIILFLFILVINQLDAQNLF